MQSRTHNYGYTRNRRQAERLLVRFAHAQAYVIGENGQYGPEHRQLVARLRRCGSDVSDLDKYHAAGGLVCRGKTGAASNRGKTRAGPGG